MRRVFDSILLVCCVHLFIVVNILLRRTHALIVYIARPTPRARDGDMGYGTRSTGICICRAGASAHTPVAEAPSAHTSHVPRREKPEEYRDVSRERRPRAEHGLWTLWTEPTWKRLRPHSDAPISRHGCYPAFPRCRCHSSFSSRLTLVVLRLSSYVLSPAGARVATNGRDTRHVPLPCSSERRRTRAPPRVATRGC